MGLDPTPIDAMRVPGVLLILGGVFLIPGVGAKKPVAAPAAVGAGAEFS